MAFRAAEVFYIDVAAGTTNSYDIPRPTIAQPGDMVVLGLLFDLNAGSEGSNFYQIDNFKGGEWRQIYGIGFGVVSDPYLLVYAKRYTLEDESTYRFRYPGSGVGGRCIGIHSVWTDVSYAYHTANITLGSQNSPVAAVTTTGSGLQFLKGPPSTDMAWFVGFDSTTVGTWTFGSSGSGTPAVQSVYGNDTTAKTALSLTVADGGNGLSGNTTITGTLSSGVANIVRGLGIAIVRRPYVPQFTAPQVSRTDIEDSGNFPPSSNGYASGIRQVTSVWPVQPPEFESTYKLITYAYISGNSSKGLIPSVVVDDNSWDGEEYHSPIALGYGASGKRSTTGKYIHASMYMTNRPRVGESWSLGYFSTKWEEGGGSSTTDFGACISLALQLGGRLGRIVNSLSYGGSDNDVGGMVLPQDTPMRLDIGKSIRPQGIAVALLAWHESGYLTVEDTFTRANSSSLGTTEVGSKTWTTSVTAGSADVGIDNNQAYSRIAGTTNGVAFSYVDTGSADIDIEVSFYSSSDTSFNYFGVVARWVDANNYVSVEYTTTGAGGTFTAYKVVSGTKTALGTVPGTFTNVVESYVNIQLRLVVRGTDTVDFYVKVWWSYSPDRWIHWGPYNATGISAVSQKAGVKNENVGNVQNTIVIDSVKITSASPVITPPSGYTVIEESRSTSASTVGYQLAYKEITSSGDHGGSFNVAYTGGSNRGWAACMAAILPASAGARGRFSSR